MKWFWRILGLLLKLLSWRREDQAQAVAHGQDVDNRVEDEKHRIDGLSNEELNNEIDKPINP